MQSKAHDVSLDVAADIDRWRPHNYARDELAEALVEGRIAGPVTSHDRQNVIGKIERLVSGEVESQFGIRHLGGVSFDRVLALMADETGFDPDPALRDGPSAIDPTRLLDALEAAGRRLALAADRRERLLLATGHPAGLLLLYMEVARLLRPRGVELLRPLEGEKWRAEDGRHRQVRYFHGVAVLTDRASTRHTHDADPMRRMLEAGTTPDLVFADHGFAGTAIQAGIETISIVDVNDPAPVVAKSMGRTELVIVMDDNVQPEYYWPCFQAMASQLP